MYVRDKAYEMIIKTVNKMLEKELSVTEPQPLLFSVVIVRMIFFSQYRFKTKISSLIFTSCLLLLEKASAK